MSRLMLAGAVSVGAVCLTTACGSPPPQHYGYLALLGRDTISIESDTRTGRTIVSDEVDRFPRVRRRHTVITLAPDGSIEHLVMDIRTPSESASESPRHVVAYVTKDSVIINKTDRTGEKRIAFATGGALAMPHLPQMYGLTDLYFAAALARAPQQPPAAGTEIKLRQYYIDREFDRFPLHEGIVRVKGGGKVELEHDWLAGLRRRDGGLGQPHAHVQWRAQHVQGGGHAAQRATPRHRSDRRAVRGARDETGRNEAAECARHRARDDRQGTMWIDYGRPLARGRKLLGDIIPYGEVWRTGANAATQFSTSAPDHARRHEPRARDVHAVDRAECDRRRPDREQTVGAVGHGLRSAIRPRQVANDDRGGQDAGGEIHDLDRSGGRASRNARDGVGAVPLDGADRGAVAA